MRKISRAHLLAFSGALILALLVPQAVLACEICEYFFFLGYAPCKPAAEDEVGSTTCTNVYDPIAGFSCYESGTFCTNINVGGGGGSGGGGGWGGGGQCQAPGFCPAQCFSCGGGGAPAF